MSVSLLGLLPACEEISGRERQGLLKGLQMAADGRELCPRGLFGIADGGRGSEPFEALEEDAGSGVRIQDPTIEKNIMVTVGDLAAGGEFHHGNTREHDST